jgi:hypothetical protein
LQGGISFAHRRDHMLRGATATLVLIVGCSSSPGPAITPTGGSGGSGGTATGGTGGTATSGSAGTVAGGSGGGGSGGATGGSGGGGSGGSTGGVTGGSGGGGSGGAVGGRGGGTGGDGSGGCGGAGGTTPECAACVGGTLVDPVEACLLAADGTAVLMSLTAPVTVVSFDQVAGSKCNTFTGSAATESRLIVEDATAKRWTIYLRLPDLPTDLVKAGDALDLKLTASPGGFPNASSQLIVLTRAGALVAFGLTGSYLPGKVTDDVMLASAGVCSVTHPAQCYYTFGLGQITVGGSSALIGAGQTKVVGNVAVTLDTLSYFNPGGGGCDGSSNARAGGFTMPPAGP